MKTRFACAAEPRPCPLRSKGLRYAALLAAAVISTLALGSCAGMSGGAYERSVEGDSSAAAVAARRKRQTPPPASTPSAETGASGFLFFTPTSPQQGWIAVRGLPEGARLYVDSRFRGGSPLEAEEGEHLVEAAAFGREPWAARVLVRAGQTVTLDASLPPAVFRLSGLEASPASFDPEAPGSLGRTRLEWTATAPGRADLTIRDRSGREVTAVRGLALDSESGRLNWDGRNDSGRTVPPGLYFARLEASGKDGSASSLETSVEVTPYAELLRFSSLHGGFSGALFAPDARVLGDDDLQAAAGAYLLSTPQGAASTARMPSFAGIRVGGLFDGSSELVVSGMWVPYLGYPGVDPSWGSVAFSLKTSLAVSPSYAAALLLSGCVGSFLDEASSGFPPSWDGPARFPGLGAGIVLEGSSRRSRIFGSLQAHVSTFYPGWDDLDWDTPGLFAWAYGRLGAEALVPRVLGGDLALALSAAARTEPFGGRPGFRPPLSVGAEAHWYAPETGLVVSAYAAGEWAGFSSWYYAGGFGVGLML